MKGEENWLVSDRTCRGCRYYGWLEGLGCHCCDYTYITGAVKKNPPARCEVREEGRKAMLRRELTISAQPKEKERSGHV